jgi:hypothetical protein
MVRKLSVSRESREKISSDWRVACPEDDEVRIQKEVGEQSGGCLTTREMHVRVLVLPSTGGQAGMGWGNPREARPLQRGKSQGEECGRGEQKFKGLYRLCLKSAIITKF